MIARSLDEFNFFFKQGYSRLTEAEPEVTGGGTGSQWEERGGGKYGCRGEVSAQRLNGWEYYATKFHLLLLKQVMCKSWCIWYMYILISLTSPFSWLLNVTRLLRLKIKLKSEQ